MLRADIKGSPSSPDARAQATRPDAQHALDECITATSLIEVTLHSLDAHTLATPEQEVLKKALQSIWSVYGWIDGLNREDLVSRRSAPGERSASGNAVVNSG